MHVGNSLLPKGLASYFRCSTVKGAILTWFSSDVSEPFPSAKVMDEEGNTALTSRMWEVGGADMAQSALLPMYAVLFSRAVACLALYTSLNSFSKGTVAAMMFLLLLPLGRLSWHALASRASCNVRVL